MADIPILGETTSEESQPELTDEQKEALAAMGEAAGVDETEGLPTVTTAFLVIITEDGQTLATGDLSEVDAFKTNRLPTVDDIYGACASVQKDLTVQETARATIQGMMATTQAMAQRQQEAALRAKLNLPQG